MANQAGVPIRRPGSPGTALGIRVISPYVLTNQVVSFMRQNLWGVKHNSSPIIPWSCGGATDIFRHRFPG